MLDDRPLVEDTDADAPGPAEDDDPAAVSSAQPRPERIGDGISFRTRLTVALVAAAVLPLASFGLVVVAAQRLSADPENTVPRILLLTIVIAALLAVLVAFALASDLTAPLRAIAAAVDRVSTGDLSTPIEVNGDDELARLAESHNRLAAQLERRNRELGRILAALVAASPRDGVDWLIGRAAEDARSAFGMIDARVLLVDPETVPAEERVPGEALPVRAALRAGDERLGAARRPPARHPGLGSGRPGPPGAVRQRDRGRGPERPAVRAGRRPERPAPRARRRQGRLPARGQPQPPDAADEHPRLQPSGSRPSAPTVASGSSPSRPIG